SETTLNSDVATSAANYLAQHGRLTTAGVSVASRCSRPARLAPRDWHPTAVRQYTTPVNNVRDILEAIRALPRPDRLKLAEALSQEIEGESQASEWPSGWVEATAGSIADPTFVRQPQGEFEEREKLE